MTRRQLLLMLVLVAGLTGWAIARPDKAAHAASGTAEEITDDDYGANDEETASRRWASGQTRHWRYLVVKR